MSFRRQMRSFLLFLSDVSDVCDLPSLTSVTFLGPFGRIFIHMLKLYVVVVRVVHGSISCDPTQPNPSAD